SSTEKSRPAAVIPPPPKPKSTSSSERPMFVYREPRYGSDVFSSGTVIVPGVASDRVLHPAAGPIKITRTGNDPAGGLDFDESEET
ncbi:hypothetical protein, partial [Corynebacterium sp. HMSC074E01]|uniref:hypothetical protein n=2 Tax=unclassified Corynebacterium TaxID=2624378 RepID=UPI001AF01FE7